MGLKDKLTNGGSSLSIANGNTPSTNPGATGQSNLHAQGTTPGYSLDGSDFSGVNTAFQQYVDGVGNVLPQPSQLDLNGVTPPQYLNNLPS